MDCPGSLSTLGVRPTARRQPGPGEVEVEVSAAGLNFLEVLYALGMLPGPPEGRVKFGLECAGKVTAVGRDVTWFQPGDDVFGLAPGSFSGFATTSASSLALKPDHLSPLEAATIPAAYTTAYYSLITRGRLRRGERVLIHAAAGGVGLAAVNVARWRGAEILATAGTAEKREHLRSMGIPHVMDSRSLDFVAQAIEATGGRGVDVVLNSLGGDFIPAGLSVLARHGRFLELGKRDIFRNTPLGLASFEKHLSFIAIDVGTDLPDFPSVWRKVVHEVRRRAFPPLPFREFSVGRSADAFETMAQAKHIGKIVITINSEDRAALRSRASSHRGMGRPLQSIIENGEVPPRRGETPPPEDISSARREHESRTSAIRLDPSHSRPSLKTSYRAPRGEAECAVAGIWQELLGVSGIGADDSFFELRGDSLLAAQVTSRLYQVFRVKLPLSSLFQHPTVAALASRIEQLRQSQRELETAPAALPREGEVEHEI